MGLWSSEHHVLLAAFISSAEIWSVYGDLYPLNPSLAVSTSKGLGSGTNGLAVCSSVYQISLTPCTFKS